MDLQLLQSFLALADAGSFTKAAERQHLSQPAFSRRIKNLEHWVGTSLVDRSTYPLALTPAGQQLRRRGAELLEGLQRVRDEARGNRQLPAGAVRIVTSHTLALGFFPRWWRQFCGDRAIPCRLTTRNTAEAGEALAAGTCDLLLTYTDPVSPTGLDPAEFEHTVLGTDTFAPYACVVDGRPKFRLPGSAHRPVPLLDYGEDAFFGRIVDDIVRRSAEPLHAESAAVTDFAPGLKSLVLDGAGVAWLPGKLVSQVTGEAAGRLAPAGGPEWWRKLDIRLYRTRAAAERAPVDGHLLPSSRGR